MWVSLRREPTCKREQYEHRDVARGARGDGAAQPEIATADPRQAGLLALARKTHPRAERPDLSFADAPPRLLHRERKADARQEREPDGDPTSPSFHGAESCT